MWMRLPTCASSARAAPASSAGMARRRSSSTRRRSTARPSRALSALIRVPTAVSRKTGATTSWMTCRMSGTCDSTWGSSSRRPLLLLLFFFREQVRPLLEDVFELGLGDQHDVFGERLLAGEPLVDLLQALFRVLALGPGLAR